MLNHISNVNNEHTAQQTCTHTSESKHLKWLHFHWLFKKRDIKRSERKHDLYWRIGSFIALFYIFYSVVVNAFDFATVFLLFFRLWWFFLFSSRFFSVTESNSMRANSASDKNTTQTKRVNGESFGEKQTPSIVFNVNNFLSNLVFFLPFFFSPSHTSPRNYKQLQNWHSKDIELTNYLSRY